MNHDRGSRLWVGVALIALGLLFLLAEFRPMDLSPISRYWPFLILFFGAVRLATGRGRDRWGGFWMIVTGIYCAIGVWRPFGLSWGTAWPLFVIGAGVSILGRASGDARCRDGEVRVER
jgi:hypothetical protein